MKNLFSIMILGMFIPSVEAQDISLFEKKVFEMNDLALPYRILYPEDYNPTKVYPLVLFLHGAGERGDDNEKQLTHGVSIFLKPEHREKFPCIVIAPQCPSDSYWASADIDRSTYPLNIKYDYNNDITLGLAFALNVTKQIIETESVDTKRIYITGLSMGGMGSFEAIYRFPDLFSASAIVCGGGDDEAYSSQHTSCAFWIFHGADDAVIHVDHSRRMYERLLYLNADVRYTEYPEVNHNSWENAYQSLGLLDWMFSQSK